LNGQRTVGSEHEFVHFIVPLSRAAAELVSDVADENLAVVVAVTFVLADQSHTIFLSAPAICWTRRPTPPGAPDRLVVRLGVGSLLRDAFDALDGVTIAEVQLQLFVLKWEASRNIERPRARRKRSEARPLESPTLEVTVREETTEEEPDSESPLVEVGVAR
jgi:hypothetical protein